MISVTIDASALAAGTQPGFAQSSFSRGNAYLSTGLSGVMAAGSLKEARFILGVTG
jgi:hypothetical protein